MAATSRDALKGYEILLGITGGVSAYKAAYLCSLLVQRGAGVTTVMTANAGRFIGATTFCALTGRRVYTDLFESADQYDDDHIRLTDVADLIVVAPATANIIAKQAAGICDDLLSTLLCSVQSGILLAPAMNDRMWNNPATQHNIATLGQRGVHRIGPESGRLACGTEGVGRMSEPQDILKRIIELLAISPPKSNR
jgi:phosphopantothenoylcysteine synthetase/decarboxylase